MKEEKIKQYLKMALEISKLSTCRTQDVGAVLASDGVVIGVGYNGNPAGMEHCKDGKCFKINNHCILAVHAEMNTLINSAISVKAASNYSTISLFSTHKPCVWCLKLLINAGVSEIYYIDDYEDYPAIQSKLLKRFKVVERGVR